MIRLLEQADKEIIMDYLERNEMETTFMYANVVAYGVDNRKDMRRCADYFGYFSGEALKGIIPFYNLGSCIPHYETAQAVPFFAQLMKDRQFKVLLGMKGLIMPLYDEIREVKETKEYSESIYFVNKNFRPFSINGIDFIEAGEHLNEEVLDFIRGVRENGFNEVITAEEERKILEQKGEEEDNIIALKDGKMVAMANVQTYTPKFNQIGSVYTVAEERGKGYAKAVVSEVCSRIRQRNKVPTLFAVKTNVPAVRAYTALGFEYFDDYMLIKFA